MQRVIESCWSTSTRKRHKNLREKGWYMYIAKYLRKISTFPLNFKYILQKNLKGFHTVQRLCYIKKFNYWFVAAGTELGKGHGRHVWQWARIYADHHFTSYVHNMIYHVP